ncbi:hypothetical protein LAG73_00985 [Pseudoxanthomonas japonensis]|nr:hypothetical protein LAG73_00985 [Pseudoxanthomonas japonensis]
MSRWTERFQKHQFQAIWTSIKDELAKAIVNDESVITDATELGRLKRVVSYVDGLLRTIDPELVPLITWDNFASQASLCHQQIVSFNSSKNIGHIQQANEHADNLLTYVRPYMVVTGRVAKNLRDSAAEYINALNKYAESFVQNLNEKIKKASSLQDEIEESRARSEEDRAKIDGLILDLLGGADSRGKVAELNEKMDDFHKKYGEVVDLYNETIVGDSDNDSTKESIEAAAKSTRDDAASAREALQKNQGLIDELTKFYGRIFGTPDADGRRVGGLEEELKNQRKSLSDFESEQKIKYQTLNEQIEDLLPGAASAGLASAYSQMRTSFEKPLRNASWLFFGAVGLIVFIAFSMTIDKIWLWGVDFSPIGDFSSVLRGFIYKVPILGPLVWLAFYASSRRSECQRLQQEYAHKEALAKSYDSYKKQISALGGDQSEMLTTLITKAIDAIAFNASQTLDGKHGDNPPFQALMEKMIEKIPDAEKAS